MEYMVLPFSLHSLHHSSPPTLLQHLLVIPISIRHQIFTHTNTFLQPRLESFGSLAGLNNGSSDPLVDGLTKTQNLSATDFPTKLASSPPIKSYPPKYGWIKTIPTSFALSSPSDPTLMPMLCTMLPPALSPAKNTRSKSTYSFSHTSPPLAVE
ncbi:hypothetical protein CsSME_00009559 [Camellia sinensis var. sinensis]